MAGKKLKTHSGASKRFKKTASGRVLHKPAGRRHLLTGRTRSQKRRLKGKREVSPTQSRTITRLLPND